MVDTQSTMVKVKRTTHSKLKSLKLIDRETFDEVINRLIKQSEERDAV